MMMKWTFAVVVISYNVKQVSNHKIYFIYFFTEVLKLILQANPFVKIFIE